MHYFKFDQNSASDIGDMNETWMTKQTLEPVTEWRVEIFQSVEDQLTDRLIHPWSHAEWVVYFLNSWLSFGSDQ